MSPLQVGVGLSTSASPEADPVGDAVAAEALGFDFVSASDHPCGRHPTNETWTMLAWVAASTTTIRVATRVLGAPFRNPVLTAKMAETLDRLSGGRLVLGLGAGGSEEEMGAMGLPPATPRERVAALGEAVRIVRGVWASPAFSFDGDHHRARGATLEPKPARPIPVWLGTFGERALALTGRLGDGWVPTLGHAPAERLPAMRRAVLAAAEQAGRPPEAVTCVLNVAVAVGEGAGGGTGTDGAVVGPAGPVADRLTALVELGFAGLNLLPLGPAPRQQYERLALEVVPALRRRT